jgi:site-specific recombinase XerD
MTHSNKSISLLRQRMIDDMTMRKLSPKTQAGYLRAVIKFTLFFGRSPDLASPEDLRTFQLQQVEQGVSSTTINATITGLRFFFDVTLERPSALKRMSRVRKPQKLPQVLSVEEVERLLAGASNPKHRAALREGLRSVFRQLFHEWLIISFTGNYVFRKNLSPCRQKWAGCRKMQTAVKTDTIISGQMFNQH